MVSWVQGTPAMTCTARHHPGVDLQLHPYDHSTEMLELACLMGETASYMVTVRLITDRASRSPAEHKLQLVMISSPCL